MKDNIHFVTIGDWASEVLSDEEFVDFQNDQFEWLKYELEQQNLGRLQLDCNNNSETIFSQKTKVFTKIDYSILQITEDFEHHPLYLKWLQKFSTDPRIIYRPWIPLNNNESRKNIWPG